MNKIEEIRERLRLFEDGDCDCGEHPCPTDDIQTLLDLLDQRHEWLRLADSERDHWQARYDGAGQIANAALAQSEVYRSALQNIAYEGCSMGYPCSEDPTSSPCLACIAWAALDSQPHGES